MAFKRLVRFAIGDTVSFGDLLNVTGGLYKIRRLSGDPFTKLLPTDEVVEVDKVCSLSLFFMSCCSHLIAC